MVVSLPLIIGFLLAIKMKDIRLPYMKKRIGMLYNNMEQNILSILYYPFFMLRRFMIAAVIVFLSDYPFAQI
jgi:hypothetical protein